jgi:hypothetical protein
MGQKNKKNKYFPKCLALALGEGDLFPECQLPTLGEGTSSPSALSLALGEGTSSPSALFLALGEGWEPFFIYFLFFLPHFFCEAFQHYLKLLAQIWLTFEFFCYISFGFSFSLIFRHTSNLNYRYMKSYNLAIQKMIFMIFGVY